MFGMNTYKRIKEILATLKAMEYKEVEQFQLLQTHTSKLNLILANVRLTHSLTMSQLKAQNIIISMQQAVIADSSTLSTQIELAGMINACYAKHNVALEVPVPTISVNLSTSGPLADKPAIIVGKADEHVARAVSGSYSIPEQSTIDHGGAAMFGIGMAARAIAKKAPDTGEHITTVIPGDSNDGLE